MNDDERELAPILGPFRDRIAIRMARVERIVANESIV